MFQSFSKRLFDLAVSIPALVILGPLMALLALLVCLNLGRPVFYCPRRPGLRGKPFVLYKFRTMTGVRGTDGALLPESERMTRFSRFLRRASLDELPELFNVVKGDLSLVGPRPLLMDYLERYTPEQMRRHEVKPGITGWAQINGRNDTTWEKRFAQDLWYVEHHSLLLDCRIVLKTAWLMLTHRDGGSELEWRLGEYMGPNRQPNRSWVLVKHKKDGC